jgi:PPK2 family polyphosphate:nucleotide phosphotransferase
MLTIGLLGESRFRSARAGEIQAPSALLPAVRYTWGMQTERYRVLPGTKVRLRDHDPDDDGGVPKADGRLHTLGLRDELGRLQEMLYADGRHKVLVILQAIDAGGKDGTIRAVFEGVNPQGVSVASFKRPTDDELAHDFLWRIHHHTPRRGHLTIFNRSHYEDVLVVRVHGLVPQSQWQKRYEHIVTFENMLVDEGTTVLKFFLHISKDEQRMRQQSRIDDPTKRWKFASADIEERKHWDAYQEAFEAMLHRTSTDVAPWYVIPANRKWYRNLLVSQVLVDTLRGLNLHYPEPEDDIDGLVVE